MNPSPEQIGLFVVTLTALLALPIAWKKFSGASEARSISPQPLEVKQTPKFTESGDCDALHKQVDERIQAVEDRANQNMKLIREELARVRSGTGYMQQRMDGIVEVVFAIGGRMGIVLPKLPSQPMEDRA